MQEVSLLGRAVGVDDLGAVRGPTWPLYTVRSLVVRPSDDELRAATGPDEADPTWTALPASVPDRVRALGQQLAGDAPTRLDAVRAVERWLAVNATYRLDSPVPAPGSRASASSPSPNRARSPHSPSKPPRWERRWCTVTGGSRPGTSSSNATTPERER